ncbi:MAG: beta-propeller fold lactonase family protein, partial [SAR202 cluster bacterium]|nr:beta-propeller fold lactonase family protein [SAR202 cluster bacterium]
MPAKQLILTGLGIILGVLTLACGNTAPPKAVGIVGEPRIAPTSTALPEPSPVVVATNIPGTPTPVVATSIPVPTAARVAGPPRPVQPTVAAQVTPPVVTHARAAVVASAVVVSPDGLWVVVVNPDSDSVTVVDAVTLLPLAEISVGHHPRTLTITPDSRQAVVANHGSGTLSLIDLARLEESTQWPVGAMPYGVVTDGSHVFFTEFGSGRVGVIDLATNSVLDRIPVDPFPAGLALSADGRSLLVTHLFTGQVTLVDTTDLTASLTVTAGSGTNMSQFITISPDGSRAYLPQTRSNSTNAALLFDTTVFPVVNVLNIGEMEFLPRERISLDVIDDPVNMPFSAALAPNGQTLYVSNAGSDDISVIDLDTGQSLAQIPAGANPRGIAITPDGDRVFVANVLDGTMSVMNTESLAVTSTVDVTDIPLATDVLLGKKIFNSAAEPRLTTDNWISCAVCHFDGGMDARTWVGFPDGPRNTP